MNTHPDHHEETLDVALATPAPDRDEPARVRAWRVERFERLILPHAWGPDPAVYARELADRLADARADDGFPVCLHAFERYMQAGCDPDIAEKLLVAL